MMRKIIAILFIFVFLNCKTITKEEYLTQSCKCINNIETTENEILKNEIADCLSNNFVTYNKMAKKEIEAYLGKNSKASRQDAQDYLVNMLHKELGEKCPTYKEANKKLDKH